MKKMLIGLGNPIVGDDRIGLAVMEELLPLVKPDIKTLKGSFPAFALMEAMVDMDEVYIVDAIFGDQPGEVIETPLAELSIHAQMESMHRTNLYGAVRAGKRLGLNLPERIQVLGIKIEPAYEFTEQFTPPIQEAFPRIIQRIKNLLTEYQYLNHDTAAK